jgi:predicted SAM-dependent methyltransferase
VSQPTASDTERADPAPGLRIEVGAGARPTPGYLHVDVIEQDGIDVLDDGRTLATFADGVAQEIYSHWFLEHVAFHEVPPMLEHWKRVLAPGGMVHMVTNNHEAHNRCLFEGQITWREWSYLIYAVDNRPGYNVWDIHKCAWNQELLAEMLDECGFVDVDVEARWKCRHDDGRLICPALIARAYKPS